MAQINLPHQLTNGTVADATQVMSNFQAIVDVVNGNLGSDNLGSISGADVTTTDVNGGTNTLENFSSRFQVGMYTFLNVPSKTKAEQDITFPVSFPGAPILFTDVYSVGSPQNVAAGATHTTASGCRLHLWNGYSDTRSLTVTWLAIYIGAWS